jgi:hypothetical protein
MTKTILMKSLLCLLLANSFSCAKKNETRISAKQAVVETAETTLTAADEVVTPVITEKSDSEDKNVLEALPVKSLSGDHAVAVFQVAEVASADNSAVKAVMVQVASADKSVVMAQAQAVSADLSVVTAVMAQMASADNSVTSSADNSVASVDHKIKNKNLQFTDIKVLDADMLNNITSTDARVLFENYITSEEKASKMIALRKFGVACRFSVSEKMIKNDILKFKAISTATALDSGGNTRAKIQFVSDKKTLDVLCQYQGELSQAYFNDNFFDVIDFKNAKGKFSSDTVKKLTYEQIVEKTKSMKIVNVDKLLKADVNNEKQKEKFGIIAGELVEETKSILDVQFGRAKQACAVVGVKGELKNNKIFKLIGVKSGSESIENNYATMQIYYGNSTDHSELVVECTLRRNGIGPGIVFETFKGILEYGVLTKTPVKK